LSPGIQKLIGVVDHSPVGAAAGLVDVGPGTERSQHTAGHVGGMWEIGN